MLLFARSDKRSRRYIILNIKTLLLIYNFSAHTMNHPINNTLWIIHNDQTDDICVLHALSNIESIEILRKMLDS